MCLSFDTKLVSQHSSVVHCKLSIRLKHYFSSYLLKLCTLILQHLCVENITLVGKSVLTESNTHLVSAETVFPVEIGLFSIVFDLQPLQSVLTNTTCLRVVWVVKPNITCVVCSGSV